MRSRAIRKVSRPWLALVISLTLGGIAVAQIVAISALLLFGRTSSLAHSVVVELSVLDWVGIYGLAGILALSMKHLFHLRKRAVSWFSTYVGLGGWAALLYSFSPEKPHFDELASLAGLFVALSVLAYLHKLKREKVLR